MLALPVISRMEEAQGISSRSLNPARNPDATTAFPRRRSKSMCSRKGLEDPAKRTLWVDGGPEVPHVPGEDFVKTVQLLQTADPGTIPAFWGTFTWLLSFEGKDFQRSFGSAGRPNLIDTLSFFSSNPCFSDASCRIRMSGIEGLRKPIPSSRSIFFERSSVSANAAVIEIGHGDDEIPKIRLFM
jgi:hypothetical protein